MIDGLLEHPHQLVNVLLAGHDGVDVGAVQKIQLPTQILDKDVRVGHGVLALGHEGEEVAPFLGTDGFIRGSVSCALVKKTINMCRDEEYKLIGHYRPSLLCS